MRPQNATPKSCFTADTEIATLEGKKRIEAIEIGDLVWAQRRLHDEISGENLTYHEILEPARTMFNK